MSEIDKYNAPRGFVAVAPDEYSLDGAGECIGCCFNSGGDDRGCLLDMQHDCTSAPCWGEGRADEHDVIFKRDGDGSVVALDSLKKSLDNLPAAWRVFQQHKAAKTLHSH